MVVGPDGAGKTTLARGLLSSVPHRTGYVHFRPGLFQEVASLPPPDDVVPELKVKPARAGSLASVLRLLRSWALFWLGFLMRIRPMLKAGGTVVGDRWVYGYIGQPEYLGYFGPEWLARWAVATAPRPDLVVRIVGDPALISSRKGELSVDEVQHELERWSRLRSVRTLDLAADLPVDLAVSKVISALA